jgi:ankyrin repeat protein
MSQTRFRWVFCQLETLRQCLPGIVRQTIRELPESLDATYEQVIKEITKANRAHAYRLLQCLMVAIRPLYVEELAEVLAFDFDSAPKRIPTFNANWCWEDQEKAVLSTCSSLVTVAVANDSRRVVQFSHFSVKEFLMSDRLAKSDKHFSDYHIALENAHIVLTRACLGVLLSDPNDEHSANRDHLAKYAAKHWMIHAQVQNVAPRVRDGIERLFDVDRPYFDAWIKLHDIDHLIFCSNTLDKKRPEAKRFYYAALCGLHHLVKNLIRKYPQYAGDVGGNYGSALHVASDAGHLKIVRLLLQHGVSVDVRGMWDQTPLQFASDAGRLDVVKLLLGHRADANSEDESRWTPLFHAISKGHLNVVRTLLEHGAHVNIQDSTGGRTPLHVALLRDKPHSNEIVRLLLEHDANPNACDNAHQTPLHLLTPSKRELVAVLRKYGADVGVKDKNGRTPSQALLKRGHSEIAKLLSG